MTNETRARVNILIAESLRCLRDGRIDAVERKLEYLADLLQSGEGWQRDAMRELVTRIRPKREYCNVNGESYCRDNGLPDERSCPSCNRWKWADALAAVAAPPKTKGEETR